MNRAQLQDNLHRLFNQEDHRLVFWFDSEQEFVETLPELELDGVHVLHMDQWGSLDLLFILASFFAQRPGMRPAVPGGRACRYGSKGPFQKRKRSTG